MQARGLRKHLGGRGFICPNSSFTYATDVFSDFAPGENCRTDAPASSDCGIHAIPMTARGQLLSVVTQADLRSTSRKVCCARVRDVIVASSPLIAGNVWIFFPSSLRTKFHGTILTRHYTRRIKKLSSSY